MLFILHYLWCRCCFSAIDLHFNFALYGNFRFSNKRVSTSDNSEHHTYQYVWPLYFWHTCTCKLTSIYLKFTKIIQHKTHDYLMDLSNRKRTLPKWSSYTEIIKLVVWNNKKYLCRKFCVSLCCWNKSKFDF